LQSQTRTLILSESDCIGLPFEGSGIRVAVRSYDADKPLAQGSGDFYGWGRRFVVGHGLTLKTGGFGTSHETRRAFLGGRSPAQGSCRVLCSPLLIRPRNCDANLADPERDSIQMAVDGAQSSTGDPELFRDPPRLEP